VPTLGASELVIVLVIVVVIYGSTKLPQIHAWLSDPLGSYDSWRARLAERSRWRLADALLFVSVIFLGLLAAGLAVSAR
jgi:hypothetical protein